MRTWIHLTAKAEFFVIVREQDAAWLWALLRRTFPDALAVCLMGTHVHVVVRVADLAEALDRLRRVMAAYAKLRTARPIAWKLGADPVDGVDKLGTVVRYVHLNPCRAGAAEDPLRWLWSTHRDVVGAIADPWVTADRLAAALEIRAGADLAERLHHWISNDESVLIGGTAPPLPAEPRRVPVEPLGDVVRAVLMATRAAPDALRRRGPTRTLFVQLARRQAWDQPALLAEVTGVSRRALQLQAHTPPLPGLGAAALCLGDGRLLVGTTSPATKGTPRTPRASSRG